MLERFDRQARLLVARARDEAVALGHGSVGTEHLLLALTGTAEGVVPEVLASAGITGEDLRAALEAEAGERPAPGDAAALRAIGIDLDAVRSTVEEAFGPGALERAFLRRPGRRLRRGCSSPGPLGGPSLTPRCKKVLELALRQSLRLRHDHIGPEHVLLGLLAEGEGLAARLLTRRGVRLDDLRRRVLQALGQVA